METLLCLKFDKTFTLDEKISLYASNYDYYMRIDNLEKDCIILIVTKMLLEIINKRKTYTKKRA